MCMQAGTGNGTATPEENTEVRLYPCNKDNKGQKFDLSGDVLKLLGSKGLCVGFQGTTAHVGSIMVLKECGTSGTRWITDGSSIGYPPALWREDP